MLWSLPSGFGCAMNAAGCSSLVPDFTGEALRILMPPLLIGVALMVGGLWKRHNRVNRKGWGNQFPMPTATWEDECCSPMAPVN